METSLALLLFERCLEPERMQQQKRIDMQVRVGWVCYYSSFLESILLYEVLLNGVFVLLPRSLPLVVDHVDVVEVWYGVWSLVLVETVAVEWAM